MTATPATKTSITAQNGKSYEFTDKQKRLTESTVSEDGTINIVHVFRSGEVGEFTMHPIDGLYARAAMHGLDQKFGDALAGSKDAEDWPEIFERIKTQLSNGDWNTGRVAGELAGASKLIKAMMVVVAETRAAKGLPAPTVAEVREQVSKLTKEQTSALRKQPKVAAAIAALAKDDVQKAGEDVLASF